jgi:tetraacyldisaccharide 4'-kinase
MKLVRTLLLPLSWFYALATDMRNAMYDKGILRTTRFDVSVLSVGNITVGGTGKTPMVEMIATMFAGRMRMALLSRGYGRKTSGFRLAGAHDNADTIGDEPYQYRLKFGVDVPVAVGEERAQAIPEILVRHPDTQLIILDDAFQHRSVHRDVNVLLVNYRRPIYDDHVMPAGRLRERRRHARRADAVVVTKCPPALSHPEREALKDKLQPYVGADCPVFYSYIEYLPLEPVYATETPGLPRGRVVFFSGIASDKQALSHLEQQYPVAQVIRFPDHFRYTEGVLRKRVIEPVTRMGREHVCLITTEKDMARILSVPGNKGLFAGIHLYYLPIRFRMFGEEDRFDAFLSTRIDRRSVSN